MSRQLSEATIARKLNAFGANVMARYPQVNAGGCCVFAALISAKLTKVVPTKVRVEGYSGSSTHNIDHIRPQIANNGGSWDSGGVYFNHVLVSYEVNGRTWFYDARGTSKKFRPLIGLGDSHLYNGALTITETSYLAAESYRWDPSFDRADIFDLIEMVDEFFMKEFKVH